MLQKIKKNKEYLDYIQEHYMNVQAAWKEMNIKCKNESFIYDQFICFTIDKLIKEHDLSKMSEQEFVQYRRAFHPTDEEKSKGKYDMSEAWENHKKNNPHHWENWTLKDDSGNREKEVDCICMVVDWMAMGYKFGDTPREFYESKKDTIILPDWAIEFIYSIFDLLEAK